MLPEVLVPAEATRHRRSRRDWFVDSVFFVLALLIGALVLGSVDKREDLPEGLVVIDVAAGLIGCGLLWVRRRWPVHVAVVLGLMGRSRRSRRARARSRCSPSPCTGASPSSRW